VGTNARSFVINTRSSWAPFAVGDLQVVEIDREVERAVAAGSEDRDPVLGDLVPYLYPSDQPDRYKVCLDFPWSRRGDRTPPPADGGGHRR
jgi:hypothetical protein